MCMCVTTVKEKEVKNLPVGWVGEFGRKKGKDRNSVTKIIISNINYYKKFQSISQAWIDRNLAREEESAKACKWSF